MILIKSYVISVTVALRKESVDRNAVGNLRLVMNLVALRKESVDRNLWWGVRKAVGSLVALRKESVDRNFDTMQVVIVVMVALRKESVDRNWKIHQGKHSEFCRSPQGERG